MSYRTKRVGDEIRKVISENLIRGLRDPVPGFVTVREVEVNRDFTRAKVFYSVIGSDAQKAEAQVVLDENRGLLRREVGKAIRTRNTPELVFIADDTGERAARIHQLLEDVRAPAAGADAEAGEGEGEGEGGGDESAEEDEDDTP